MLRAPQPRQSTSSRSNNMATPEKASSRDPALPRHEPVRHKHDDGNGYSTMTPHIKAAGESGRRGFGTEFFGIAWRSSCKASSAVNVLWPVVPAAIAVKFALPEQHLAIFILAYIAMVPCANLIGFAGQEFGRKMPPVAGVLVETTFGSIVEIILFLVLAVRERNEEIIKAAILGSILANLLLCLGLCFWAAGMRRDESHFSEAITEAGCGLLLTAGIGLAVPTVFTLAFQNVSGHLMLPIPPDEGVCERQLANMRVPKDRRPDRRGPRQHCAGGLPRHGRHADHCLRRLRLVHGPHCKPWEPPPSLPGRSIPTDPTMAL